MRCSVNSFNFAIFFSVLSPKSDRAKALPALLLQYWGQFKLNSPSHMITLILTLILKPVTLVITLTLIITLTNYLISAHYLV